MNIQLLKAMIWDAEKVASQKKDKEEWAPGKMLHLGESIGYLSVITFIEKLEEERASIENVPTIVNNLTIQGEEK